MQSLVSTSGSFPAKYSNRICCLKWLSVYVIVINAQNSMKANVSISCLMLYSIEDFCTAVVLVICTRDYLPFQLIIFKLQEAIFYLSCSLSIFELILEVLIWSRFPFLHAQFMGVYCMDFSWSISIIFKVCKQLLFSI